ncbi:MAG TPA: NAD(P)H-binding protein, partial [Cytophagaceae bacterium]|nr:NAD(P)H-binding protein [Cytophagaceae bacterium]
MKIIITGSLGHISKPLTGELVQKGHSVIVISSKPERKEDIEVLGAKAAIGTVEDVHFLTSVFAGADAVYCMLPPGGIFSDPDFDVMRHADKVVNNYVQAIQKSGVKKVVYLSSIGAHTDKGNGILAFHYNAENSMKKLSADIAITFMRPVGFYYNMLGFINGIKAEGVIASNYGAEDMIPWVSPIDIATAVAEEIGSSFTGRKVRYVVSEEITCNEAASILGTAIGKPDLKWIVISDEQL